MYLVPSREDVTASLARWGVAPGDRIVFYDDAGQGRHAIRGYWLLRLYGFPAGRIHVLDGGLAVWRAGGHRTTAEATEPTRVGTTEPLHERDDSLIATAEQVLEWSREAAAPAGPTRLLDVRQVGEFLGTDVRPSEAAASPDRASGSSAISWHRTGGSARRERRWRSFREPA